MRLIDADITIKELNDKIARLDAKQQIYMENGLISIADSMAKKIELCIECRELLEHQPTAYDVDKVVEELERLKETEQNREDECDEEGNGDAEQIFSDGESQGKFRAYLKAIEVVKAGGINNNVSKKM